VLLPVKVAPRVSVVSPVVPKLTCTGWPTARCSLAAWASSIAICPSPRASFPAVVRSANTDATACGSAASTATSPLIPWILIGPPRIGTTPFWATPGRPAIVWATESLILSPVVTGLRK
jgi:hypothetical protein